MRYQPRYKREFCTNKPAELDVRPGQNKRDKPTNICRPQCANTHWVIEWNSLHVTYYVFARLPLSRPPAHRSIQRTREASGSGARATRALSDCGPAGTTSAASVAHG